MFNFGNANEAQKKAITTAEGPVRIIAGPGTGKTYTLIQRAIYLIEECGVRPESIFVATFTEKAAKELITRITNAFSNRGINVNINDMYIGTFHSLCLRILREHLDDTRLSKNYRILDDFDQHYLVSQNMKRFGNIRGINNVISSTGNDWKHAEEICRYVNILSEELVASEELKADQNTDVVAVGEILETYQAILKENNMMDFSSMQTETYKLFYDHLEILEELQSRITHIMIDEYQDTNYVQEQLVLLLGGDRKNICVVGDDDQALYRFRGATVRNILEFPQNFAPKKCKKFSLVTNYRSNSDIVDFYNRWMVTTQGNGFGFNWDDFRHDKRIEPHEKTTLNSPAVVKLSSQNDENAWHQKICKFIKELKDSGKITDYNQIAFLFRSVKNSVRNERVIALAQFLEANGINVYSPRSKMFFQREEIQLILGCLLIMFPNYADKLINRDYESQSEYLKYYRDCILLAKDHLMKPENKKLLEWVWSKRHSHSKLKGTTDYAYSGLIYRLFRHRLFSKILDTDVNAGVINTRPVRNISKLTKLIGKFEAIYRLDFLDAKKSKSYKGWRMIDLYTEHLFNHYLRLLYDDGIGEYEDESEYAPSGCVSFMTIHQSKGLEFPIVIVASLREWPWPDNAQPMRDIMNNIEQRYFKRTSLGPLAYRKYFDFWRLYYTAFSRAQNLLVLTCNEDARTPRRYFRPLYGNLPSLENQNFDIREFTFEPIHNVNLKNTYSFTSHVVPYETCCRQYKFYKELGFHKARARNTLLGTLVHETIEDIHRAVLRHEEQNITEDNIKQWFNSNYGSLSKSGHMKLTQPERYDALKHVLRYVAAQNGNWSRIKQAEVKLSLAKPDYIIEGKIDLIRSDGDKVEIVDFKTERKPVSVSQRYRRQLHVYAYLVEQCTGQSVSKMILYYTGEDSDAAVTFNYDRGTVNDIMANFDNTVHQIERRDFRLRAGNNTICGSCDFRFYC